MRRAESLDDPLLERISLILDVKDEPKKNEDTSDDEEDGVENQRTQTPLQIEAKLNIIGEAIETSVRPARRNYFWNNHSIPALFLFYLGASAIVSTVFLIKYFLDKGSIHKDELQCPKINFASLCTQTNWNITGCSKDILLDWCAKTDAMTIDLVVSVNLFNLMLGSIFCIAIYYKCTPIRNCLKSIFNRMLDRHDAPENPLPLSDKIKSEVDHLAQRGIVNIPSSIESKSYDEIQTTFKKDVENYNQAKKISAAFFSFAKAFRPDLNPLIHIMTGYIGCEGTSEQELEQLVNKYKL